MDAKIPDKKNDYFLSQPHQPFFVLAIANAIVAMLIFALAHKGVLSLEIDTATFHSYSLIFMVFTNVFIGFLFTTYTRFCQASTIGKSYYVKILYANALGSLLFLAGSFLDYSIALVGMAILFVAQIFTLLKLRDIYAKGTAANKEDPLWILIAQFFGVFSNALFILSALGLNVQNFAVSVGFYAYVVFLTFSVAQRMIPFFSHSYEQKSDHFIKIVFALFALKTISSALDFTIAQILVDVLLAAYLLKEFINWKLPLFGSPAILWVLHLGLFWLPAAFFISALTEIAGLFADADFLFIGEHLLAIGFVTTILIGFGTRVALGHSGQSPHADGIATKIFWFIQAVVVLRALYSLNVAFGWGADFLFDASFSAWLLLFLAWGARYSKVLIFGSKL